MSYGGGGRCGSGGKCRRAEWGTVASIALQHVSPVNSVHLKASTWYTRASWGRSSHVALTPATCRAACSVAACVTVDAVPDPTVAPGAGVSPELRSAIEQFISENKVGELIVQLLLPAPTTPTWTSLELPPPGP